MKNFELVKIFTTLSETSGGGAGGCGGCGGGGGKSNFKDFFRSQKTRIFFAKIDLVSNPWPSPDSNPKPFPIIFTSKSHVSVIIIHH